MTPILPANDGNLRQAAGWLRSGQLVAFPTETVYGLGANGLSADAVEQIFRAKGRPSTNPIILHVLNWEALRPIVSELPPMAEELAQRFWPGPLTLVLKKSELVPAIVTANGPTVAVRSPSHPIARQLLELCGFPLAAPSANASGQLSPTTAQHVQTANLPGVQAILDGGPCVGGLESTVLDLSQAQPRLLRPGLVSQAELEATLGPIELLTELPGTASLPSPGLLRKHYSPRTALECPETPEERDFLQNLYETAGLKVGRLNLPADPRQAAQELFAELHRLDAAGWDRLLVVLPPNQPEWQAIRDRLLRAAAEE